jgi:hypothetical protein
MSQFPMQRLSMPISSETVDTIGQMENLLSQTDNRSANPLSNTSSAAAVEALHNDNPSGMESMDIVRRGDYLYAMQQEPGKEALYIPITPEKATAIVASRNQLRRDATERLRTQREELEGKMKIVKGLRAAGFTQVQIQGIEEAVMGMDYPNAQAYARDLLMSKVKTTGRSGTNANRSPEEIQAAHQQKIRHGSAQEARRVYTREDELGDIETRIKQFEGMRSPVSGLFVDSSRQVEFDALLQQQAALAEDASARRRNMAIVGRYSVPNTDETYDSRSYLGVASASVGNQGGYASNISGSIIPLLESMPPISNNGKPPTQAQVISSLNQASMRFTGRIFATQSDMPYLIEAVNADATGQLQALFPELKAVAQPAPTPAAPGSQSGVVSQPPAGNNSGGTQPVSPSAEAVSRLTGLDL